MKPKLGTGILSCESNAPILPVLIEGAENVLSPLHPRFHFCKIKLRFGDSIFASRDHHISAKNYAQAMERWEQAILRMQNQKEAAE
jgi:1-acyl-sn-glycerol-3-phosphate acyltransferase